MTEITIEPNDEAADVAEVTDVIEVTQEAETLGMEQGLIIGRLAGQVEAIVNEVKSVREELTRQQEEHEALLRELLSNLDRMDAEAEAEAEAVAEIVEAEDEVIPGSRRTHWFFRPADEWRRD